MLSLSSVKNNFTIIPLVLLYVSATFPMGVAMAGYSLNRPLLVILLILAMINYFKVRVNDPLPWFVIAIMAYVLFASSVVLFQNGEIDGDTVEIIIANIMPFLACFVFIDYYSRAPDTKMIWVIVFFAILVIIIRSTTAINAEIMNPGIARNSATGMFTDVPGFDLIGAGSYSFINGLIFLLLPIIYVVRSNARMSVKIILIILCALSLGAIVYTSWAAALILWFTLLLVGLAPKKKKHILLYIFILLSAIVVVVNSDFVFQLLKTTFTNNPELYDKVIDIQASLQEGDSKGQLEERQSLYLQSIDSFLSNPVLGDINSEAGGHAFWFDHLASFGIVGTIPLLVAYLLLVLKSAHLLPRNYKPYHYINSLILIIFGCVKGVGGYEFMIFLCVIGPLLTRLADSDINHKRLPMSGLVCR